MNKRCNPWELYAENPRALSMRVLILNNALESKKLEKQNTLFSFCDLTFPSPKAKLYSEWNPGPIEDGGKTPVNFTGAKILPSKVQLKCSLEIKFIILYSVQSAIALQCYQKTCADKDIATESNEND